MTAADDDRRPMDATGSTLDRGSGVAGRAGEWFLLEGDRLVVTAMLTAVFFLLLLGLETIDAIAFVNEGTVTRVTSGMIAGTFSLVTIVVSINQLILSREFVDAGTAEERLSGVESFRGEVAELAGVPAAPAVPAELVELLAETMADRADALGAAVADHDPSVRTPIERYVDSLTRETDRLDDALERATIETFDALSLTVRFDDDWYRYAGSHLRNAHAEALSEPAVEAFDDVRSGLRLFAIAREHFKTTYLQRELTRFSQLTILVGLPSITSAFLLGFLYAGRAGPTLAYSALPPVVSALVAVVFAPLALLVAYILRTATITRRSASTGPMRPTATEREDPFGVTSSDDAGE